MKRNSLKRIAALMLAALMLMLVFTGCGEKKETASAAETDASAAETAEQTDAAAQTGDLTGTVETVDTTPDPARYGGTMSIVYGSMDDHLDINAPGATAGTHFWARYVYENAFAQGLDGKIYPLVCEYEKSDDNKTLKVWTREGVTFHDGTDVTIEDVMASYRRNQKHDVFQHVIEETYDGDTVTMKFDEQGCLQTLYYMAYTTPEFGVMPKWICEQFDLDEGGIITDPQYVIGTGCYKLVPEEYINQEQNVVVRYEDYVTYEDGGADNGQAAPRRAYLDKIYLLVNKDSNNRLMHLLQGDYDVITMDAVTYKSTLEPMGYKMYYDPSGMTHSDRCAIIFNCHKGSTSILGNDANLRKAIMCAIDYPTIEQAVYSGWSFDTHTPVEIEGYTSEPFDNAPYTGAQNLELAKEYLAKSNYNGEMLILRRPSGAGSECVFTIQQLCAEAGINLDIETVEMSAYTMDYRSPDTGWDMYNLYGTSLGSWPGLMPVNSYVAWGNEEAAALRDEMMRYESGEPESVAAWEKYAALMADECPWALICKSKGDRYVQSPGLHANYNGFQQYYNAYWDNPAEHME